MSIRFDNRVAIVTGAGNGLGKSYALGLAARGAKVVVNDVGSARDGQGRSASAAQAVVDQIRANGGQAIADGADVTDPGEAEPMVDRAKTTWGRVDILINNAGILRDKTFAKMDLADFRTVLDVHLMGSVNCSKAVWQTMRDQGYGRILMTSSSSGLYGNFGQSNYGAAKAAVVGLMRVLHHEGRKHNIRVNAISPAAATRMTGDVIAPEMLALLTPDAVAPAALFLVSEIASTGTILCAGAGTYSVARLVETPGIYLPEAERTPESIASRFGEISDMTGATEISDAFGQTNKFLEMAKRHNSVM